MATVPEKKKSRLSKLFNRHHDQASSSGHAVHPSTRTGASGPIDSAYASSENDMSKRSQDMVPVASGDDRNLAMNQNTGEVVDEDTGEVVTVTTTTTTTTTTKTKGGKTTNVQVETAPGGGGSNPAMVEAPGDTPASGPRVSPHPAIAQPQPQRFPESTPHPSQPSYPSYTPQPAPSAQALPASQSPYPQQPSQHSMGSRISTVQPGAPYSDHSDESTSHQTQAEQKSKPQFIPYDPRNPRKSPSQHQEDPAGPSTMAVPERNPNRAMSREENSLNDPVSPVVPDTPTRQNFSYPARSNQNLRDDLPAGAINNVAPEGDTKPQSTFENLKAAAVGLHVRDPSSSSYTGTAGVGPGAASVDDCRQEVLNFPTPPTSRPRALHTRRPSSFYHITVPRRTHSPFFLAR
ncbi:hypothetical protein Tdes44962_MAKER09784 [Teratosphaeria destructans]|uniref:Uncharacterized protein n=1 Tax=Teratosphaeria destructans TaxID=418781 RepID=A0A9W7SRH1_9PEZI|nr:hypothetical protein Tdes44962_MAKER09784 [Teratosphaeria destructans]